MQPQRLALLTLALLALVHPLSAQTLKGSRASMQRQYQLAVSYGYTFLKTPGSVGSFVENGYLVKVGATRTMTLHAVSYPYARPEVKLFIERLSEQYYGACGEKMTVTSLTRPVSLQPANASEDSVHPTGMAVDLRVPGDAKCRKWLESTLLALEGTGVLDVTREYRPPHFHVAVYTKIYGNYVASLQASEPLGATEYVVQRGDTLSKIADRTGSSIAALRGANALRNDLIQVGQKLQVPGNGGDPGLQVASTTSAPIQSDEAATGALPVQAVAAVAVRNAASAVRGNGSYVVKRGDSLARIAERTGTTVADLRRDNGLRGNLIHPGQTLQIPGEVAVEAAVAQVATSSANGVTAVAAAVTPTPASHVVRPGESLATIAARAGITVDDLRQLNDLRGSLIHPGQSLRLAPESQPREPAVQVATVPMPEELHQATVAATETQRTPSARPADYVVRRGDSLATIAARTGLTIDDLRRLNALRGNIIHPGQNLRLAPEPEPAVTPAVQVATVPLPQEFSTTSVATTSRQADDARPADYVVRRGDSLATIAARVGVTIDDLREFNALRGTLIHPGQTLRVVPEATTDASTIAQAVAASSASQGLTSGNDGDAPGSAMLAAAVSGIAAYEVRKGDTLSTIATRTGTSILTLRQANGLRNDMIRVGQTLVVPTLASMEPVDDTVTVAVEHEVRRGESLWRIANRYGTTVNSLRRANALQGDSLTVGQILRVSVDLTSN